MGLFKSARAVQGQISALGKLTPGHSAGAVRAYSDQCEAIASQFPAVTTGDVLVLSNAMLREMDRRGGYDEGFDAVVEQFNSRTLVGVSGTPLQGRMPSELATRVMELAAKTLRSSEYMTAVQEAMRRANLAGEDDRAR